jgi:hypothetical protein
MTYFFFRFSLTGQRILAIQPSDRALIGGPDRDGLTESAAEPPWRGLWRRSAGEMTARWSLLSGDCAPTGRTGSELSA